MRNELYQSICSDCGLSHAPENRRRLIARMRDVGATVAEIKTEFSCFYGLGHRTAGERRLYRDLMAIRASRKVIR